MAYVRDVPVAETTRTVDRHDPATGRWVTARIHDEHHRPCVRIEAGSTGNRLDPTRRVRRRGHDLLLVDDRLELRAWWPVQEIRTHLVGQFEGDLRGDLRAGGSDDPAADLVRVDELAAHVFGRDEHADGLTARTLRSAYPLLRRPVELGARPLEVPLVVEPVLRHVDPRTAARATLGPRVTRPLVRALAECLLPDERGLIVWEPLVLALMAADRCGPEQLTAILTCRPHRPGAVSFSLTDRDRARAMFAELSPRRVADALVAALADADGTAELIRRLNRFNARPPAPPPAPAPPPRPRAAAPPAPPAAPAPRPARDPADRPIEYPRAWREAAGREVNGLRVVLPATGNELMEWGASMGNCLGAYRNVVADQRTRIIGFAAGRRLRYAAEISAGGALRQLEAPGNTRPIVANEQAIVAFLRDRGLIDTDARQTEPF